MPEPTSGAESRMFDGLSPLERRAWIEAAHLRSVPRGTMVARQGERATELHLVESGLLKVLQLTAEGRELIVRFAGAGDPFGGVVALSGATYPVSATVAEAARLYAWPVKSVLALLERTPGVRVNLMREMATHMTEALTRVREMSGARVPQRLALALLRLADQCGRSGPSGVTLAHGFTREDLAQLTGTTLYTVSRTLSQWAGEGIVVTVGRRLLIAAPERLQRLAQE